MKRREPTHEEVERYYRDRGLLGTERDGSLQSEVDIANAGGMSVPGRLRESVLGKTPKGSQEAKERMAKVRAAKGKQVTQEDHDDE